MKSKKFIIFSIYIKKITFWNQQEVQNWTLVSNFDSFIWLAGEAWLFPQHKHN